MDELKLCPFCGGKAKFTTKGYINSHHTVGFNCVIECANCGCSPIAKTQDLTFRLLENGAIEMTDASIVAMKNMIYIWNQRSLPKPTEVE